MDTVSRFRDVIVHDHSFIIRKMLLLSLQEHIDNYKHFTSCSAVISRKHIDDVFQSFPLHIAGHERGVPYNNSNLKHRSRYKTIIVIEGFCKSQDDLRHLFGTSWIDHHLRVLEMLRCADSVEQNLLT